MVAEVGPAVALLTVELVEAPPLLALETTAAPSPLHWKRQRLLSFQLWRKQACLQRMLRHKCSDGSCWGDVLFDSTSSDRNASSCSPTSSSCCQSAPWDPKGTGGADSAEHSHGNSDRTTTVSVRFGIGSVTVTPGRYGPVPGQNWDGTGLVRYQLSWYQFGDIAPGRYSTGSVQYQFSDFSTGFVRYSTGALPGAVR
ncbi:UNVERIFIED_CONTAM: hypothetical protein FKN15_042885 [Acipenser sinensis]